MKITHVQMRWSAAALCGCALSAIAIPALVMSIYAVVRIDDRVTDGTTTTLDPAAPAEQCDTCVAHTVQCKADLFRCVGVWNSTIATSAECCATSRVRHEVCGYVVSGAHCMHCHGTCTTEQGRRLDGEDASAPLPLPRRLTQDVTSAIKKYPTYDIYTELTKSTKGESAGYSFWKNWNANKACLALWSIYTTCQQNEFGSSGDFTRCKQQQCAKYKEFGDDSIPQYDPLLSGTIYYQDTYVSLATPLDPTIAGQVYNGNYPTGYLVRPYNWVEAQYTKMNNLVPPYNSGSEFIQGFNKFAAQAATHLSVAFTAPYDTGTKSINISAVEYPDDPGLMYANNTLLPKYEVLVPDNIKAATVRIVSGEPQSVTDEDLVWLLEIYQLPFDYQNSVGMHSTYGIFGNSYDEFGAVLGNDNGFVSPAFSVVNDNEGSKTGLVSIDLKVDLAYHEPNNVGMYYVPKGLGGFYDTLQTTYVYPDQLWPWDYPWPYANRNTPNTNIKNRIFGGQWIYENGPVLFGVKIGKGWSSLTIITVSLKLLVDNNINWREVSWSYIMSNDNIGRVVQFTDKDVPTAIRELDNFRLTITQPVKNYENNAADMLQRGYTSKQAFQVDDFTAPFWDLRERPVTSTDGFEYDDAQWINTNGSAVPLLPSDFLFGDSQIRKTSD